MFLLLLCHLHRQINWPEKKSEHRTNILVHNEGFICVKPNLQNLLDNFFSLVLLIRLRKQMEEARKKREEREKQVIIYIESNSDQKMKNIIK